MLREAAITRDDRRTVSVESVAVSFIILYFWVLLLVKCENFDTFFDHYGTTVIRDFFIVSTSRPSINMIYVNTRDIQC